MCKYAWLYECFDECNFSSRVYTFVSFIHKVRLCRRAPGSGLNLKLDAPVRNGRIPAQDKKTHPSIPSFALLPPFPAPQHWPVVWMARPEWVNRHRDSSDSPVCSLVPFWVTGKILGQIWKHQNELRTSWEPAENGTAPFSDRQSPCAVASGKVVSSGPLGH